MIQKFFSKEEFVKQCIERGYALRSEKKRVLEWCDKHPKDYYTEEDLILLYGYLETPRIGEAIPYSKWRPTWDGHRTTKRYDD